MKIAIAGYGNVGKSLEKIALTDSAFQLTAIASRRRISNKLYVPMEDICNVDAEVVLLALGSYSDIAQNVHRFENFHTVDCFDTHEKLLEYKKILNQVKPDKISLCATGWDPGVLSIVRGTLGIFGNKPTTRWGTGISQGHSNALRNVDGVLDAVSVTVPQEQGHLRLCYVACVSSDKKHVEQQIRTIPNYFENEQVEIVFCSTADVRKLKKDTSHVGQITAKTTDFEAQFQLRLHNNCDFTAKIMLAYAKAVPQLQKDGFHGALDPFDVPLKYVTDCTLI